MIDSAQTSSVDMTGPIAWMAKNSVAANLIMLILMIGGVLMAPQIKQEVFPEVSLDTVVITVPYPGASPEEVEQGIVLATESAVRGIEGVDEIRATAAEGAATVAAELSSGTDAQRALNDIKSAVDRITSFPQDAEDPQISLATNRRQVVTVIIHGDVDRHTLKMLGEEARNDLLTRPSISLIEISGLPAPEISIEVPQEKLRKYNLTLPQVANIVRNASIDLPGGSVRTDGGEVLVRTTERRKFGEEFFNLTVLAAPDGTRVPLHRIATIKDTFKETDRASFFDGEQAVKVEVFRIGDQTPLEISAAVEEYVDRQNQTSSEAITYSMWQDRSEIYRDRINLLLDNSYLGLALVLLILGIFLEIKLAFWVTLGIPISFLGAMIFMPAIGVSLNMISLFAFLLTLGIVVDDAIVVGEAIYAARAEGKGPLEAAVAGTREVGAPVVFAVLTTCIAFSPLLFVPGVTGKFFINIPMIVIPIFLISLIEVFFVLPAHLAHSKPPSDTGITGRVNRLQKRFANFLERIIKEYYQPVARLALEYRYVTLAGSVGVLMVAVGIVGGGFINFTFLPKIEGDRVVASVQMPVGTAVSETREVTDRLVDSAQTLIDENQDKLKEGPEKPDNLSRGLLAEVGAAGNFDQGPAAIGSQGGSHLTEVAVELVPAAARTISARDFAGMWREKVGEIAGADSVDFEFSTGPGAGAPVAIELRHPNTDILERAASDLAESVKGYAGVFDVNDGFQRGKQQLDLTLKPGAKALGISEVDLANQIRASFFGAEARRVQRGRDELRVYVRRPEAERDSTYHIMNTLIQTPDGGEIPLKQAAHIERGRAYTEIEREGGARVVDVTADVDTDVTTGNEVVGNLQADVLPGLLERYPDLSYELAGAQQEQAESLGALGLGFAFAMLAMYALMAIAFSSYLQPAVIMVAIPFGLVGALAGHLLMGFSMSIISMFGVVALSGVVVNDSLVLISAVNRFRDQGHDAFEALVKGGMRRFRPILLTSLTTFFGLAPMIFETSVQARFLVPMALSLGFGVLFVTVICLIIVPCAYMVVEDGTYLFDRVKAFYTSS